MPTWLPPVYLYFAGRGQAGRREYYNDVSTSPGPRRLLIKHTLSGEGTLYLKNRRWSLPVGQGFVIERPGPYAYAYEGAGEPWCFEFVSIAFPASGEILPEPWRENPVFALAENPELLKEFRNLVELGIRHPEGASLSHSAQAYRFYLAYLASRAPADARAESGVVRRLKLHLDEHFAEEINLGELAETLGCAPETLSRLFRQAWGLPPTRYLNLCRLRQACRWLESGSLPLDRIAKLCGFANANYFGRVFQQHTGRTPGQYRRAPDPLLLAALQRELGTPTT